MLNQQPAPKDIEIASPPTDTVSDLCFSPTRLWEIQPTGASIPRAFIQHEAPPLTCAFTKDGTRLFATGSDGVGRLLDLQSQQTATMPNIHDAPIKCARFVEIQGGHFLATAGWDKMLKYWDLRQPSGTPTAQVQLPERAYTMDAVGPLLVVGTAERHLNIINLQNPGQIFKTIASPLKWQTRSVACFHDARGFAVGSIEGRVGIQYVDDKESGLNFSFKCHREGATPSQQSIYSVNSISFHPVYGTFSTAGADGGLNFWDKDSKQRLKQFSLVQGQITSTSFSRDGKIFACAVGYDWSKGHEYSNGLAKPGIFMLAPKDEDVKPRPPKPKTGR
ncbi:WD40 repeat-like protein [Gonapodya prolifera JEL478]|uniref:WD40 repeat-like protein n=1 Tax=Gonapodya prolifera (strain JEL478) TaxID=1344416 RepID=A0A139AL74_GONPJ|nr:WD40 repeat-like protein [Gonapodya prolifera JEL478]|eukprot:KXS17253.1 WD40 repeat-like protein [Gonapodya prolifera JEL478]